ncbi:hypothetical protein HAZT_HAZT002164 [Hyalella azteca]|uniref:Solute carrier family 45 member 1 n=1 Tax=Hyalella azteca TaxID=294128 RepID=A0A6A0GVP2_HYAAZ|nr:hypothetical protein HAZT_HAZT002164 [Hyalella azteca]
MMSASGAEKLSAYAGGLHLLSNVVREKWANLKDSEQRPSLAALKRKTAATILNARENAARHLGDDQEDSDYAHIFRPKSRLEMVRISAAVMGIEFCYAAETAFVSPTLLKIGVHHSLMTLIWCLSPSIGFFLTPVLGSLSDRCLILVPNGKLMGQALGDTFYQPPLNTPEASNWTSPYAVTRELEFDDRESSPANMSAPGGQDHHPWSIFFTIVGTILLDFDADACQSPARAYLLDVTIPEDHGVGLSTFTIMAGLGGSTGYVMGAINWDANFIGDSISWLFGGHIRAVFTLVLFIYLVCVVCTITAFKEIPLARLLSVSKLFNVNTPQETTQTQKSPQSLPDQAILEEAPDATLKQYLLSIVYMPRSLRVLCLTNLFCWMSLVCYSLYFTDFVGEAVFGGDPGTLGYGGGAVLGGDPGVSREAAFGGDPGIRRGSYVWGRPWGKEGKLCLGETLGYGGEAAFGGDSDLQQLYEAGVRFGCWGMALYSLSCSCYSFVIEKLVKRFGYLFFVFLGN